MADDRTRPPFRPGGRRPIRIAGHRRRDGEPAAEQITPPVTEPTPTEDGPADQAAPSDPAETAAPATDEVPAPGLSSPPLHGSPWAGLPTGSTETTGAETPGTEPPAAEPPGTEPPGTEPPAAEPPLAGAGTESPSTEPPLAGAAAMDPTRATYPRLRWSLLGLASVAVVLLLVVTLLEYSRVQRVNRLASARTAALSAATRAGKPLLSYDYRTLDQQAQMTDPLLTPAYRKKYDATINNVVRTIAVPNKAVLTADVKVAGIRDVTESTASVLLYADLSSTNNQRPDTRVDHTPLVVCMVRTGGNWLVDDVETKLGYQCGASGGQPSSTGSSPATSPPATSPLATGSASPAAPTPSPSAGPRTPAAPSSAKPGAGTPTSP